jgi:glycosyltransferase involved in cell wall biosynthesis
MIRVLQLMEAHPDHQTEVGRGQLARDASGTFQTQARTIGRGGDYRNPFAAIVGLRRSVDRFDVVHAWGSQALTVASLGAVAPIVYSPSGYPGLQSVRWIRSVVGVRDVQIIVPTDTMRRAFVTRGVPADRCHIVRPGVDFASINRRRDAKLREALGFGPNDYVILAPGESTRAAAHRLAVWTVAILHVLDSRYRLLLWGRGPLAEQSRRLARQTRLCGLLELAERRLGRPVAAEELLAATDAVLITATGPVSTHPVSVCMAAGLPIVALVTPTLSELLEDRHTALMVGKPAPRLLAQRVLDLRSDTGLQWTISDMARTEAYEYFSRTRYLNQFRAVYRQVASGEKVEVPQQPPGAGLRFHGRA